MNYFDTPKMDGGSLVFGVWPQNECDNPQISTDIWLATADGDGYLIIGSERYAGLGGKIFNVEPIRWKPLLRDGAYIEAIAENLLVACPLNEKAKGAVIEDSDAYLFLNGEFKKKAFHGATNVCGLRLPTETEILRHGLQSAEVTPYAIAQGAKHMDKKGQFWINEFVRGDWGASYFDHRGMKEWTGVNEPGICLRPIIRIKIG